MSEHDVRSKRRARDEQTQRSGFGFGRNSASIDVASGTRWSPVAAENPAW